MLPNDYETENKDLESFESGLPWYGVLITPFIFVAAIFYVVFDAIRIAFKKKNKERGKLINLDFTENFYHSNDTHELN